MAEKINKVVLAYSGGLDTSVILKWLIDSNDGHSDIINAPTGSFGQHVGTGPMVKHHPAVIGAPRAVMPGINSLFTK